MLTSTVLQSFFDDIKATLKLGGPIVVAQIGQILFGVCDSMMVGKVGAAPLAASAFALGIFHLFLIFALGVTNAVSTFVSQAYGAKRIEACRHIVAQSLIINLVMAVIFVFLIQILCWHLEIFVQTPEVTQEARGFLRMMGWSLIPALLFQSFRQFSEGIGQTILSTYLVFGGLVANIFFNWLFIYGHWGFPRWELFGSGLATLGCRSLMVLAMVWMIYRDPVFALGRPRREDFRWAWHAAKPLLKVGIPSGCQYLFEVAAFSGAAIMAGWMGVSSLAAHQITLNLCSLIFMLPMGFSIAISIRIGHCLGANDWKSVRRVGVNGFILTACIQFSLGLILFLGRHFFPSLYVNENEVLELASHLLVLAAIFQIPDAIQCVAAGACRGILDIKFPTILCFIAYWVLTIPLSIILGFKLKLGISGIWWSYIFGLSFAALVLSSRFILLVTKRIRGFS